MTPIRYDIIDDKGGWCIRCGEVVGPPYNRRLEALRDAQFIARELEKAGVTVEVALEGKIAPPPT